MAVQPADRVVGEVLAEVIALLRPSAAAARSSCCARGSARTATPRRRGSRRSTRSRSRSASCGTGRPGSSRPPGCCATSPTRRSVAVLLEHLGAERAALRDLAGVAVPVVRQLGDLPVADPVVVAPRHQRRARRRAHRGRVEPVEADALARARGSACPSAPRRRRCRAAPALRRRSARSGCSARRRATAAAAPGSHTSTPASSAPRGWRTAWVGTAGSPGSASWRRTSQARHRAASSRSDDGAPRCGWAVPGSNRGPPACKAGALTS